MIEGPLPRCPPLRHFLALFGQARAHLATSSRSSRRADPRRFRPGGRCPRRGQARA